MVKIPRGEHINQRKTISRRKSSNNVEPLFGEKGCDSLPLNLALFLKL